MSRPIIKFTQEPTIELNCTEEREVTVNVKPDAPGVCQVVLSIRLQSCTFHNGTNELAVEVECLEGETTVDCSIMVKMKCAVVGEYFTLLSAKAINSEGVTSFQKDIEINIKSEKTSEILDPNNDVIS